MSIFHGTEKVFKANVFTAPQHPLAPVKVPKASIFLAGPIQGAKNWQEDVIKDIGSEQVFIFNPRRSNLIDKEFNYQEQVEWETHYLHLADIIVFWLCNESEHLEGRSYAQTSRFELGEHLAKSLTNDTLIIVGVEEGFHGKKYIKTRIENDYPLAIFCNTYEELIREINANII